MYDKVCIFTLPPRGVRSIGTSVCVPAYVCLGSVGVWVVWLCARTSQKSRLNFAVWVKLCYRSLWKAVNWKVLFFGAVSLWFFVCVWNISGTAERICAWFTRKTCLVPHSDKFEGHGQRSRSPLTGDKNGIFGSFGASPACGLYSVKISLASSFHLWFSFI